MAGKNKFLDGIGDALSSAWDWTGSKFSETLPKILPRKYDDIANSEQSEEGSAFSGLGLVGTIVFGIISFLTFGKLGKWMGGGSGIKGLFGSVAGTASGTFALRKVFDAVTGGMFNENTPQETVKKNTAPAQNPFQSAFVKGEMTPDDIKNGLGKIFADQSLSADEKAQAIGLISVAFDKNATPEMRQAFADSFNKLSDAEKDQLEPIVLGQTGLTTEAVLKHLIPN